MWFPLIAVRSSSERQGWLSSRHLRCPQSPFVSKSQDNSHGRWRERGRLLGNGFPLWGPNIAMTNGFSLERCCPRKID
ncbi:hypothetical protein TNCT_680181 [Trichonephila clavata]|uniref:Uncharacterized protein n=1 Tax=Trichonephila clavata TaxID=2740835 RepID=A0A8X6HTS0_TRICU|nr:hypothetical protein TNCT_680181 [Trichonephila clavata]